MDFASLHRLRDFSCGIIFMFQIMGTLMLYLKGRTHRLQRVLFWLMLCLLGVSCFEFYVFFIHNFLGSQLRPVTNILQLTAVPLCLMVIYAVTHDRFMQWEIVLANILPYAIALAVYLTSNSVVAYYGIIGFGGIHAIGIISYGFVAINHYNKELQDNFSNAGQYSINWLRYMLLLYIGLAITWTMATFNDSHIMATIYNLMCVVIFALLYYFVYRQENMVEALATSNTEDAARKPTNSPEDNSADSAESNSQPNYLFADRLESVFSKGKIYLNATLTLNDLARELGTNRTYLSNYLNQQLHTTFYEYVNQWRVRRAKELLRANSLPLEDIALQSGFNSMSSFRRYFIAHTGMSPLEYRKART